MAADMLREGDQEVEFREGGGWWRGIAFEWAADRAQSPIATHVQIVDLTLREGEEYPDAILSIDAKLALAEQIIARGFQQLEVGYAGVIEEHGKLVRRLKQRWPNVTAISHARAYAREGEWQREVELAAEVGCDLLTFVGSVSRMGLAVTPWLAKADIPSRIEECVGLARSIGMQAAFGLTDPVRTTKGDFQLCYRAAAAAGANRLYVYDGVGGVTPEVMAGMVRAAKDIAGSTADIGVHCHNTVGLATANAIAAVREGATVVDAVPLGLGDGGGITPTEEIVTALKVFYGVETGICLETLADLSREVAEIFGVSIPGHKAVVGSNLYRHQIDAHIAAVVRGHWYAWELIRPDVLGQRRRIEFAAGKIRPGRSGALEALIERRGTRATDEQLAAIAKAVRDRASISRFLTESEVEDIIGSVVEKDCRN